jgi:hypothetical protein
MAISVQLGGHREMWLIIIRLRIFGAASQWSTPYWPYWLRLCVNKRAQQSLECVLAPRDGVLSKWRRATNSAIFEVTWIEDVILLVEWQWASAVHDHGAALCRRRNMAAISNAHCELLCLPPLEYSSGESRAVIFLCVPSLSTYGVYWNKCNAILSKLLCD